MDNVNFKILQSNLEANSIVVKPYSSEFKYPPENYAPFNINFTNLDPNKDLNTQIAIYTQQIVNSIIEHEKDKSEYLNFASQLSSITETELQTVPVSTIQTFLAEVSSEQINQSLSAISTPLINIINQAETVVNWNLNQTYSEMTSSLLLSGVEFIV